MDDAESRRLRTLDALDLLDTAPEREFDALVQLAGRLTGCSAAVLSLIDRDRLWVKARLGDAPDEVPRALAICDTTLRQDAPLQVEDLMTDARFADNPFVVAGVRFYSGVPIRIRDRDGVARPIGTLCVFDGEPRTLEPTERQSLAQLAQLAEALIAARGTAQEALRLAAARDRQATALERQDRLFRQAERMAKIGSWSLTLADDDLQWSEGVLRIHDVPLGTKPSLANALNFYPPHARAIVGEALAKALATGQAFDIETDLVSARGVQRRVRAVGEIEMQNGRPSAVVGVFRDVTEDHLLAQALRRSADTDDLTGLANRAGFNRALEAAMAAARERATPLALALIDLDGFKRVNDTLGHVAGDDILKAVARQLELPWLAACPAMRLGGDEFAVIVDAAAHTADLDAFTRRLEQALVVSVVSEGIRMEVGASVGVAAFDYRATPSIRDFVRAADMILYAAKRRRVGDRRASDRSLAAA